jgi:hypothetical protein
MSQPILCLEKIYSMYAMMVLTALNEATAVIVMKAYMSVAERANLTKEDKTAVLLKGVQKRLSHKI